MSGAPIGEIFTAEIDGQQRNYQILPRVFSSKTMEALGRLYKQGVRGLITENLKTAAEIRAIDQRVYDDFMKQVTREATSKVFVGYEQALEALSTREGIITALMLNCVETEGDRAAAEELVDKCDNILELMASVIGAGNEALEAAKNSLSPESLGSEANEEIPAP